jgi:hypothetical protein
MKAIIKFSWKSVIPVMIVAVLMSVTFNSCQKNEVPAELNEEQNVTLKSAEISAADIDAVIERINEYVDWGMLEPGLANSLTSKLENAKKTLEKGMEKAAMNQLQAVINQLEDLVREGTIDAEMGEDLIMYTKVAAGTTWICDTYSVGDWHEGGIIVYIFQPGDREYMEGVCPGYEEGVCHGIIVAPYDLGPAPWGCENHSLEGPWSNVVGYGKQNTETILNECLEDGIAADLCDQMEEGFYDDWYLPNIDELKRIWLVREELGGFNDAFYWSSSEHTLYNAEAWNFNTNQWGYFPKETELLVRAIRYF